MSVAHNGSCVCVCVGDPTVCFYTHDSESQQQVVGFSAAVTSIFIRDVGVVISLVFFFLLDLVCIGLVRHPACGDSGRAPSPRGLCAELCNRSVKHEGPGLFTDDLNKAFFWGAESLLKDRLGTIGPVATEMSVEYSQTQQAKQDRNISRDVICGPPGNVNLNTSVELLRKNKIQLMSAAE